MSNNDYKSLGDLAQYINNHPLFYGKWVSVKDILKVFEKVDLVRYNEDNDSYELTDLFKNSGGCFSTKYGKILLTKPMWRDITKDNKNYTSNDWINWFMSIKNGTKFKLEIRHTYLVQFKDHIWHICRSVSKDKLMKKLFKKYTKDEIVSCKRLIKKKA